MELKEYVAIIRMYKKLFFGIWLACIILALVAFFSQKKLYEATISLDLTRDQTEQKQSGNGNYDQYYRLGADDMFSKTIEQWLKDPNLVNTVYSSMNIDSGQKSLKGLSKKFRAEKLAPGYLQIRFAVESPVQAKQVSQSVKEQITKRIESVSGENRNDNWFKAIFSGPIVAPKKIPLTLFAIGGVFGGFLISFFLVLTIFYWKDERIEK